MERLIFASRTGAVLELSPSEPPYPDASDMPAWSARLTAAGLEAAVVAPEAGWEPRTLADFLSDLAHGSERWDGEKRWRSQDAELQLAASRPLRNTVLLVAELKDGPPTWCVRAELELDPGVFDQLAILARQLGGYPVG